MESWLRGMSVALVLRAVELGHLRSDLDVEQFVWEPWIKCGYPRANRCPLVRLS
jgi:hypothetical protein